MWRWKYVHFQHICLFKILLDYQSVSAWFLNSPSVNVTPDTVYLIGPFPGDFFGNSTTPVCPGHQTLICSDNQVPITNGRYGDTQGSINSTEFLAWNESSRITLRRAGAIDTLSAVRQVKLYFYHEPTSGIGLPELNLSGSHFDTMPLGDPLTYTILGNQDLTVNDVQVRNLTLALTEPITEPVNRFHIQFFLTESIHQFAVSEIQLCYDKGKPTGWLGPSLLT